MNVLKSKTKVTDKLLDMTVKNIELLDLAACFENTEDYVDSLDLSPGQQTDVRTRAFVHGTLAGMNLALKYWRERNPFASTYRALVQILLSMEKGDVAVHVCNYLFNRGR